MESRNPNNARAGSANRGVTLIELLIVMVVIILLAGLTLPSFRGMLQGQKVTQTARLVQGLIESARARAIASGRPVAIILDRVPVNPAADPNFNYISDNTCTRLSIGEVFPPYEGDWANSTGILRDYFDNKWIKSKKDGIPDTLEIHVAKVASLFDMGTGKPNGLIDAGDLIQLSDHSQTFTIKEINLNGTLVEISFKNPPPGFSGSEPLWSSMSEGIKFRMTRRPSKTMAGSTALPRGMCIDLSQSGVGPAGNEFVVPKRVGSTNADLYGPIFIVFNARGAIDGAFYTSHVSAYKMESLSSTGVLHLLVGRTEQVQPLGATAVSDRTDFKPNLNDEGNNWISINPFNGAVYSSPNAVFTPATPSSPPADRTNARQFAVNVLNVKGS